jgi:hypothetical protein
MSNQSSRITVTLDPEQTELLKSLQAFTGLSPAQTIQKIFPAHLPELHAYLSWLQQLPKDSSLKSTMGQHLLQSYGPESLIEGMAKLDKAGA